MYKNIIDKVEEVINDRILNKCTVSAPDGQVAIFPHIKIADIDPNHEVPKEMLQFVLTEVCRRYKTIGWNAISGVVFPPQKKWRTAIMKIVNHRIINKEAPTEIYFEFWIESYPNMVEQKESHTDE